VISFILYILVIKQLPNPSPQLQDPQHHYQQQQQQLNGEQNLSPPTVLSIQLVQSTTKNHQNNQTTSEFYSMKAKDIDFNPIDFESYMDKVVLVVNVASEWGYTTSNYQQLQILYERYHQQGLEILAFPCNQFGQQEPGTNEQIKKFIIETFRATFTLFDKIEVNGPNEHRLFGYLKRSIGGEDIKWNFEKFLINRTGKPIKRYLSNAEPLSFEADIKGLL